MKFEMTWLVETVHRQMCMR